MFNNLNALPTRAERNGERGRCVEERERETRREEDRERRGRAGEAELAECRQGIAEAGESGARRKM